MSDAPVKTFIARQPIFDVEKNVVAYELLFRGGFNATADVTDGDQATSQVLANSLTLFGLEKLTGGKQAFINMTRQVLLDQTPMAFDPHDLVVEVLEDVPADDEVVAACVAFSQAGYTLALDDVVADESRAPLVDLTHIIKVDFMLTTKEEQGQLARRFLSLGKVLLAEKVENNQEFEQAKAQGYQLFQGYFFAKPEVMAQKEIQTGKLNAMRLLQLVGTDNPEIGELEQTVKSDVSLSYRLLRFINSAFFSLRVEVKSIKQAIVLLGKNEFRKWAHLVAASALLDDKPTELFITGLIRARFFEYFATATGRSRQQDELFLLGLFSVLDAALDQPFNDILDQIPVSSKNRDALLGQPGTGLTLLEAIKAFERGQWTQMESLCLDHKLERQWVPDIYLQSIEWAQQNITELGR